MTLLVISCVVRFVELEKVFRMKDGNYKDAWFLERTGQRRFCMGLFSRPNSMFFAGKYAGFDVSVTQWENGVIILHVGGEEIYRAQIKLKERRDMSFSVRINGKDSKVTLAIGGGLPDLFINNQPVNLQLAMPSR